MNKDKIALAHFGGSAMGPHDEHCRGLPSMLQFRMKPEPNWYSFHTKEEISPIIQCLWFLFYFTVQYCNKQNELMKDGENKGDTNDVTFRPGGVEFCGPSSRLRYEQRLKCGNTINIGERGFGERGSGLPVTRFTNQLDRGTLNT